MDRLPSGINMGGTRPHLPLPLAPQATPALGLSIYPEAPYRLLSRSVPFRNFTFFKVHLCPRPSIHVNNAMFIQHCRTRDTCYLYLLNIVRNRTVGPGWIPCLGKMRDERIRVRGSSTLLIVVITQWNCSSFQISIFLLPIRKCQHGFLSSF